MNGSIKGRLNINVFKFIRSSVHTFFIDLLFPIECFGCGKNRIFLCEACETSLPRNEKFFCLFCGHPSFKGKLCLKCAPHYALTRVLIASEYENPLVQRMIKALKYEYVRDLSVPLGALLADYIKDVFDWEPMFKNQTLKHWLVVPVPLHKSRLRERGFNQAELLAASVASALNIPWQTELLTRCRATSAQVGLSEEERKENIKGAFAVNSMTGIMPVLNGKTVLLIDDVTTTGATLEEAAKVLKNTGVKEIWGLVIAKG